MKMDKIEKQDLLYDLTDILCGNIKTVIEQLEIIQSNYPEYITLHIIDNSDDGISEFCLYGYRLETDKEFEARKAFIAKMQDDHAMREDLQRQKDYDLYLELKKKFADD